MAGRGAHASGTPRTLVLKGLLIEWQAPYSSVLSPVAPPQRGRPRVSPSEEPPQSLFPILCFIFFREAIAM